MRFNKMLELTPIFTLCTQVLRSVIWVMGDLLAIVAILSTYLYVEYFEHTSMAFVLILTNCSVQRSRKAVLIFNWPTVYVSLVIVMMDCHESAC